MSLARIFVILLVLSGIALGVLGLSASYIAARRIIRPEVGTSITVTAFAYAPSPYRTDATPCITASGTRVRRGVVAANFLPMGTIIEVEGKKMIVEDRMHPRYDRAIDIFVPSSAEAVEYGRRNVEITIVGYGQPGQELSQGEDVRPEETTVSEEAPSDIFGRLLRGRLNYLSRLLRAGVPADVNRYDVDCFKEQGK